jgi:hypothetical protein
MIDSATAAMDTITPEGEPADVVVSPLVSTVIPVELPTVAEPIVNPVIVMMTRVLRSMISGVVITI